MSLVIVSGGEFAKSDYPKLTIPRRKSRPLSLRPVVLYIRYRLNTLSADYVFYFVLLFYPMKSF